mgnify:CR=1 FL=1|tara:strand:- start:1463 stop:1720 length:258 start_codon:yes stop_codon:yes gene_type:complete
MISKNIANISVAFFGFCNFAVYTLCLIALASTFGFIDIRSYWGIDPLTEYLAFAVFFGSFAVIQAGLAIHFHFITLPKLQEEFEL